MGASRHYPKHLPSGAVLQAGLPTGSGVRQSPGGLLLRGVVVATYVSDDSNNPAAARNPVAIYCDVLTYSGTGAGGRFQFFPMCLVSQDVGGMQRGTLWKPRATTMDINSATSGRPLDASGTTNPADMDGDHVILGFLDGTTVQPIVLRGAPHPSMDAGKAQNATLGDRMRLTVADGDPSFVKHHGIVYGVSDASDMVLDLSRAQSGDLNSDGSEAALPQDGSVGNLLIDIEQNAQRLLTLLNMQSAASPQAVLQEMLTLAGYVLDFMQQTPAWQIKAGSSNTVTFGNMGANATMALGDGSKHVPIAEALQQFYTTLKTKLDAFDTHTHTVPILPVTTAGSPTAQTGATNATAPTGPPSVTVGASAWDSSINSTKVSIPNG